VAGISPVTSLPSALEWRALSSGIRLAAEELLEYRALPMREVVVMMMKMMGKATEGM
jgi:hypothetical protein